MMRRQNARQRLAQIAKKMPTIGDLDRSRHGLVGGLGV
jgi:hypothetical protein